MSTALAAPQSAWQRENHRLLWSLVLRRSRCRADRDLAADVAGEAVGLFSESVRFVLDPCKAIPRYELLRQGLALAVRNAYVRVACARRKSVQAESLSVDPVDTLQDDDCDVPALDVSGLSGRRAELATLLSDGLTQAEAAQAMGITKQTVSRMVSDLRVSLWVRSVCGSR